MYQPQQFMPPTEQQITSACLGKNAFTTVSYYPDTKWIEMKWGVYSWGTRLNLFAEQWGNDALVDLLEIAGYDRSQCWDIVYARHQDDHLPTATIEEPTAAVEEEPELEEVCEPEPHPLILSCHCGKTDSYWNHSDKHKFSPGLARYYVQLLSALDGIKYKDPLRDHTRECVWDNLVIRNEVTSRL